MLDNVYSLLTQADFGLSMITPETVLLIVLLAFCLGHIVGWVYMWTHAGLSYSQMFVAALVIMPPLVAYVMVLMSGDIAIAVGLMAVFAMVRFRNVLKDTRDASFMLWSIIQGMAVGSMRFNTALIGCLCIAAIFLYLRITSFGGRHRYDVILSLQTASDGAVAELKQVLRRHTVSVQLASQRDMADHARDLSYRLLLRNPARSGELLNELETTPGVAHVSLYHREDESEI